jgi:hypothetical protein
MVNEKFPARLACPIDGDTYDRTTKKSLGSF